MREIKQLIIHCAATTPVMDIGAEEITRWHVDERGWSGIGYHYVLRRNGVIELGRDLDNDGNVDEEIGAHAAGFNKNSIGICMVGGVDMQGAASCNFTRHQWASLPNLIIDLLRRYPHAEVCGHHDVNPVKACPTFNVRSYWYGKPT